MYRDMTFCASGEHLPDCDRQITDEVRQGARALGLPLATSPFCDVRRSIREGSFVREEGESDV